ncbi:MAG: hypothetical protein ACK476_08985 [Fluviicola sp.]
MKKSVILLLCSISFSFYSFSQNKTDYKFAFGLRAGSDAETCVLSLKFFTNKMIASESIFAYSNRGLAVTSLVEFHFTPFKIRELKPYVGVGGHFNQHSGINSYSNIQTRIEVYQDGGFGYGFDFVAGIEYKFTATPFAVSLDLKPRIDFNKYGDYQCNIDKSIGVKFAF